MIINDEGVIKALKLLMTPDNNLSEKEEGKLLMEIEDYQKGCWGILYSSKEKLTPEEILKKAREINKPILL